MKRHIIQCTVENRYGVLARIASLFSARGYNISSLAVAATTDDMSVVTMVVSVDDESILEQIQKQLNKLIDVITVRDITVANHIEREVVLLRVVYNDTSKHSLDSLAEKFNFKTYDVKEDTAVLEFCGSNEQIDGFLASVGEANIKDLVRSGKIALTL